MKCESYLELPLHSIILLLEGRVEHHILYSTFVVQGWRHISKLDKCNQTVCMTTERQKEEKKKLQLSTVNR